MREPGNFVERKWLLMREGQDNVDDIGRLVTQARSPEASPSRRHQAFSEIVSRFQDLAFGYTYGLLGDTHLAEDAAQEAFLAAWQQLPRLADPAAFPGWFQRIVLSQCHRLTRGKRVKTVALHEAHSLTSADDDPLLRAERSELRASVLALIQALPEKERVATTLFYISEYSYRDIAAFLGLPVSTVKKRLYSARTRLRERMLPLVKDTLHAQRPSKDDHLARFVQFHTALKEGDRQKVEQLLQAEPALINSQFTDAFGITTHSPLTVAINDNQQSVVELLIVRGVAVTAKDVHDAAWTGKRDIAAVLVAAGGIDETIPPGDVAYRAFFRAIHSGALERVQAALTTGPDLVGLRDKEGRTALHIASAYGYLDMARLLLQNKAEVNATDALGKTFLQHAADNANWCGQGQPEVIELLAEHGASYDIFTVSSAGVLPLVQVLLVGQPDLLNAQDDRGRTPLECALAGFSKGRSAVVDFLVPQKPMMNIWMASQFGQIERVRELLTENADAARQARDGKTPLHYAAQNWCPQEQAAAVVELLAQHGADTNHQQGDFGWTPLHMVAEWWNDTMIAEALLRHGADINARSAQGWTPLRYATALGRDEMVAFLRQRGATE